MQSVIVLCQQHQSLAQAIEAIEQNVDLSIDDLTNVIKCVMGPHLANVPHC